MSADHTTAPVEAGEEYTVEMEDTGDEGDGVATVRDFVVPVRGRTSGSARASGSTRCGTTSRRRKPSSPTWSDGSKPLST